MRKGKLRSKRRRRIRKKISGTGERPRLSVFRSNKHIYIQAVDDEQRITLAHASDIHLSEKETKGTKREIAQKVGKQIGKILKKNNIEKGVFDRGGYKYHGRVKAVAEGIRSEGISF